MSEPNPTASGAPEAAPPLPPETKGADPKPATPAPRGLFGRLEHWIKNWLNPKPIRKKLIAVTMLVCTAALALSGVIFMTFDLISQFVETRTTIESVAKLAAVSSRDTLRQNGTTSAAAILNALTKYPYVAGAIIYNANGQVVARPSKQSGNSLPETIDPGVPSETSFRFTSFQHFEPVLDGTKRLGTVAVEIGFQQVWATLKVYAVMTGIAFAVAALVGRLLLGRLQGTISGPIITLSHLADKVAQEKDYSLRAEKQSDDEVGHLVDTFNNMLAEIQKRDAAVTQAQIELEANVMARTSQLHSEVVERKQTEDALKESEARYRNLFENNPMPMFVMDLETLAFVAVNNSAIKHYGYAQESFLRLSLPMITDGAAAFTVERAFRRDAKSFDAGEWRHRTNNGEVIEVQLTAHAIIFAGRVAKIVLANDVTERNRAQRQVEEMHKQLVEASRAAGMAEVATGVLHNVGNVLNSVNVSTTMLADSVRKSKVTSVRKVADLLDSNKADLPAFFGNEGKGKVLPGYLAELAQQLEAEQESRMDELDQLAKNIAHIKDIVAMQQTYAKVTGVIESYSTRALIDEALGMAATDLQRDGVAVELTCPADLPSVSVDRHKVVQILINLITNARQAMETSPPERRKLTITATLAGERIDVLICDEGCGIPAENLTRIFNHGFTTKEKGHGFGLHGAANAAKEIGGRLTGTSDGPGKGATFKLELPLAAQTSAQQAA